MPKKQDDKISVIIPIYNVAPHLFKSLNSVITQTYKNLEILLIDDGSTDTSSEIAQSFASRDSRIVYLRQQNSGVSSARNRGLSLATGEFVCFIDSDDVAKPNLIEYLYSSLKEHNADISTTTFKKGANLTATLDVVSALKELFLEQNVTFHLWAKLYRRELWEGITFPEGHVYEDVATLVQVFVRCDNIRISHKHLYNYHRREGSYVTTPQPSQFDELLRYAKQNLSFIENPYPELVPYAEKYLFTATRRTLQDLQRTKKLTKPARTTYLKQLKKYAPAALRLKETPCKEKAMAFLATINPILTKPLLTAQSHKPPNPEYH